ncbi:thioredoxin family protein [Rhodoferax sp. U2-2l]|uniref:thioredoxin family protein n=1 Tax=Rhodoferax sp. U2-2l TaxID=2884000 RepID=UPI001D0A15E4|nr:thioredoxin family protein [Rhodoferax sp. U2-2l]MCB8747317.1 thioredoxin family protein [Rhodoferax sp. U2-2l]
MPTSSDLTPDALWVVCLCAQWCNVCEQYRRNFAQVQASVQADHPTVRFLWLDIEDEAEVLDPLDVENFPTVLLAVGDTPRFFGTITPQPQTLERLVRNALQDPASGALADPGVKELVGRVRAWRSRTAQPERLA